MMVAKTGRRGQNWVCGHAHRGIRHHGRQTALSEAEPPAGRGALGRAGPAGTGKGPLVAEQEG